MYGQSGGALLVHQYLDTFGAHVARAYDASLPPLMLAALKRHAADRETLVTTFQRQNFFVPLEQLPAARAVLIRALASGNEKLYLQDQKEYQVAEVRQIENSNASIPIRVRLYEFFQPSGTRRLLQGNGFNPDVEDKYDFARPLIVLHDSSRIPAPRFDFTTRRPHHKG